jgi:hypothetical protein
MKTYQSTGDLEKQYLAGRWREGTQRNLVAAVVRSGKPWTLESLVEELDGPAYWERVRQQDKNGKSEDSWFMAKAGGVRGSIMYHLNRLRCQGRSQLYSNLHQSQLDLEGHSCATGRQ